MYREFQMELFFKLTGHFRVVLDSVRTLKAREAINCRNVQETYTAWRLSGLCHFCKDCWPFNDREES